jgi:chemotaxis protein methyltransferase CheR
MTVADHAPTVDVRTLATDIDSNVLDVAKTGIYADDCFEKLPNPRLRRYFLRGVRTQGGKVRLRPEIRERIVFRQLNLLGSWPMRQPFDVIFCRNVLIYFDAPTQERLVRRFAGILRPEGLLMLGHSELLRTTEDCFAAVGNTIYRRR